jgi:thiol-disulfide isomerase/thioredoxin
MGDAEIARLARQRQGIIVLNFWATWCEPCVEEMPILIRLHENNRKVQIVGISLDEANQVKVVRKFVAEHNIPYRIVLRQGENFETMVNSIDPNWIGALPATFVFYKGTLQYSKVGLLNEAELLQQIRPLVERSS